MSLAITEAYEQLKSLLAYVPDLKEKVSVVSTKEEVDAIYGKIAPPAAGILYEGMKSIATASSGQKQLGITSEAVFSILICTHSNVLSQRIDMHTPAHELLDAVRKSIHGYRAPSGHPWTFVVEAPVSLKNNGAMWLIRFKTIVQVVPDLRPSP